MGASRKLQGEIDRVLKKVQEGVDVFDSIWNKVYDTDNANQKEKFEADLKKEIKKLQRYRDQIKTWMQSSEIKDKKVSASYEQALMDSRKLIEREMERFKICEKETKTKAFSKEGLGQQPKTDPKEKAKSETRDWLNTVVGQLTSQIDSFEAEMEGLSVKKGKTRPPRLMHLEASIARHKAHEMKLELILRLLDNDELSPEEVNDVKDFLEDYLERNQEDFDEFSDVDELYSSLPLDKVEALEDLVAVSQPGNVKGVAASTSSVLSLKTSLNTSSQLQVTVSSSVQSGPIQDKEETTSQENVSDTVPRTPPSKISTLSSTAPSNPSSNHTPVAVSSGHISVIPSSSPSISSSLSSRGILEGGTVTVPSPLPNLTNFTKEEEAMTSPGRKSSPALGDTVTLTKGIGRGNVAGQQSDNIPLNTAGAIPSTGMTVGAVPLASEMTKTNVFGSDEKPGNSVTPGRTFPASVNGSQWRPGSPFQSQSELGQLRGRTEIAPDQREKFLQRLEQVQQQGHSNIIGMTGLTGGNSKPFSGQQQNPFLQQQPFAIHQQGSLPGAQKDSVVEDQQQQSLPDDSATEIAPGSGLSKQLTNDDDLKASYVKDVSSTSVFSPRAEASQVARDIDNTPSQPLQSGQQSSTLGVIGRRSVSDLGAIGDGISGIPNSPGSVLDHQYNLRMLEAAYFKLPQPKDSERAKSYTPRHPAATPSSYPQVQAPIVNNPAFWERMGLDTLGTDTLFFAFYYQQNTYQQYLAAKELKKQSWRYHRKFNTWFQRHEEPKVTTDDYEKGTYVYFDFHVANEDPNQGWCQRIKTDFVFEYNYLEDELTV